MRRNVFVTWKGLIRTRPAETSPATHPKTTRTAPKSDSVTVKRTDASAAGRTGCPRPNRRNARAASTTTRTSTSPEEARCVNSTQVGNALPAGTTSPLQSGQSVPHPSPDSEMRRK